MSFELHILLDDPERSLEQVAAYVTARLEGLVIQEDDGTTTFLEGLLAEVHLAYPPLDALSDVELDESPWASKAELTPGLLTLSIRWSKVGRTASDVLGIAGRKGAGVFDPQAEVYYAQRVEAGRQLYNIECPHLLVGAFASQQLIEQTIPRLSGKEDPFVIVAEGPERFAQALWTEGGYRFEYRVGSHGEHFASNSLVEGDVVVELLSRYITGDHSWHQQVEFSRVQF